ncbi:MAG TPA: MFS transporter [Candidatus Cryptobacteroides sp.]|nr:MFS transporter [Candidatus Cryptobacteroides sp.]
MKVKGMRWWVLALIVLVTIINYLDRNTLGIMWSRIVEDLGLISREGLSDVEFNDKSKTLFAQINMVFMVAYGLSQMFSGRVYDKIGTRKGFAFSALLWGISDALTSLSTGVKSIMGFRAGLGFGVAGPWPGTVKSNAEWFPQKERALAQGLFNAGASVGAILAPILIALLCSFVGWKMTFVIIGMLAPLWVIPWLIVNKKGPKEHPWITGKEREYIISGQPESKVKEEKGLSWGQLLSKKKSWAVIAGRFFMDPIWWMFVTWLPIYLGQKYQMDLKNLASHMWIPYVGAALGSIAGGWFSSKLISLGKSVNISRKVSMLIGAGILLPGLIYVAFVQDAMLAVLVMAVILFGYQFTINNIQTLCSDFFSGNSVGSLAGLAGAAATLGTILTIFFVPMLTRGDNWTPFFIMGAALVPLSILCVFLFGGKIEHESLKNNNK